MKKIISIFTVVAVVGQYLKREISAKLETQVWPDGYRAHINNYSAGWLTSKIDLSVGAGVYNPDLNIQMHAPVTVTVYHGPIEWVSLLNGGQQIFFKLAVIKGSVQIKDKSLNFMGTLNYRGEGAFDALEQNFNYSVSSGLENLAINIAEIRAHLDMLNEWKKIVGQINIKNVVINTKQFAVNAPSIQANYNVVKISPALWVGNRQMEMPLFSVSTNSKPLFSMEQFMVNSSANQENNFISANGKLEIQKINYPGYENLGPLKTNLTTKNYSIKKMEQFSEAISSIQTDSKNQMAAKNNLQTLLQGAINLLPGTSSDLSIILSSPQGNCSILGNLAFPESLQAIPDTSFEALAATVMSSAMAHVDFSLPYAFLEEMSKQTGINPQVFQNNIKLLETAGAVRLENNMVVSHLKYQNTAVTINDIPIQKIIADLKAPPAQAMPPVDPTAIPNTQTPSGNVTPATGYDTVPNNGTAVNSVAPGGHSVSTGNPAPTVNPMASTPQGITSSGAQPHEEHATPTFSPENTPVSSIPGHEKKAAKA
jgi:hypothetical protein